MAPLTIKTVDGNTFKVDWDIAQKIPWYWIGLPKFEMSFQQQQHIYVAPINPILKIQ